MRSNCLSKTAFASNATTTHLLYEVLKLRWLVEHQRTLLLKLPPGEIGTAPDQLWEQCKNVEDLVENMQTSCVQLPDPNRRASGCKVWEVPVRTGYPSLLLSEAPRDLSATARVHSVMFWRLRAQDLDTGIKVER
jgi:hypothetical protein